MSRDTLAPPQNLEAEAAVLGAVLLSPALLARLVVDEGLKPGHFYRESNGVVFEAMIRLDDRGEPIDALTLEAELKATRLLTRAGGRAALDLLTGATPFAANAPKHARLIREAAELRRKLRAAHAITEGAYTADLDKIAEGEALLASEGVVNATREPAQLADLAWTHFDADDPKAWPFPFEVLTRLTAGGMRPGGVTLVGGWPKDGKSVLLDQCLRHVAEKTDSNVHLVINEMTSLERTLRFIAAETNIDLGRLLMGKRHLKGNEPARVVEAMKAIPYGITDAAELGGRFEDVAHLVRAKGWDVVGIDIVHRFDHDDESDLARISRGLKTLALTADCHVLATVHLNEKRNIGAVRPAPVEGDIRGSGMFARDADNVLFVYRDRSEDGTQRLDTGRAYFTTTRTGIEGGLPVIFDGPRMRFLPDNDALANR